LLQFTISERNFHDQHTRGKDTGEGPQYLKIVGKVMYRVKDIEAYEEACLIRRVL
jgi:hypothetical protein